MLYKYKDEKSLVMQVSVDVSRIIAADISADVPVKDGIIKTDLDARRKHWCVVTPIPVSKTTRSVDVERMFSIYTRKAKWCSDIPLNIEAVMYKKYSHHWNVVCMNHTHPFMKNAKTICYARIAHKGYTELGHSVLVELAQAG